MPHLFELLPTEAPDAFQAYRVYQDQAYPEGYEGRWQKRHIGRVAGQLGIPEATVRAWAKRYQWRRRADAWDRYLDGIERKEAAKVAKAKGRERARRLAKVQAFAETQLDLHTEKVEALNDGNPVPVPTVEAVAAVRMVLDVDERAAIIAANEDAQANASEMGTWDLSDASIEDLELLDRLRRRFDIRHRSGDGGDGSS